MSSFETFVRRRADYYGAAEVALEFVAFPEWVDQMRAVCADLDAAHAELAALEVIAP